MLQRALCSKAARRLSQPSSPFFLLREPLKMKRWLNPKFVRLLYLGPYAVVGEILISPGRQTDSTN